ncbi:hypothetical protein HYH02_000570 [Chlamydomonas schloesseri]|uniref:Peptidase S54 rhomboid domain-containing protein n=1 Tax=Chlamydomonas schloesseri TaxID=2026947 RepID=A0A836BD00_9CHLO|nr:hypothetical protein HYH02_000570 [Chlamydomonas schloesseri]|eukprot:KAG2454733.1 hypothetical protein HYH02_000570 [Chlamydomonas schloesseri]
MAATASSVRLHLESLASDAYSAVSDVAQRVASSLGLPSEPQSALERTLRPPIDRGLAQFRWSSFGTAAVVPFPSPPLEDPRMLLTVLGLARVLWEEAEAGAAASQGAAAGGAGRPGAGGGGGGGLPLPPVTLALTAAAVWRFLNPVMLREWCLSPYCVVERREVGRLWRSALVHLDAPHLLSNLTALIPDCAALERQQHQHQHQQAAAARGGGGGGGWGGGGGGLEGAVLPAAAFAADVAVLAGLSSGLFVAWAVVERELLHRPGTYYAVGAVGLSSLAFALQVVRGEARGPGARVWVLGLPLPAAHAWLAQLALTHVTAPDASFAGHVAGVLAGVAHVYLVGPALRWLFGRGRRRAGAAAGGPGGQQPRFWGSGTTSGRPVASQQQQQAPNGGGTSGPGRALRGALTQLGLAALAVVVYAAATARRQRQPMSHWRLR